MLVEVLVGQATQLVEDSPDLYSGIGVRVGPSFGGDQKPLCPLAFVAYVPGLVMGISQNEAYLLRQLLDQRRSHLVVRHISRGETRREWDPHPGYGDGQVQLPSINPPVLAGVGPASLGVYGAVGYYPGFLVFLMPYSAFGLQSGAVKWCCQELPPCPYSARA